MTQKDYQKHEMKYSTKNDFYLKNPLISKHKQGIFECLTVKKRIGELLKDYESEYYESE